MISYELKYFHDVLGFDYKDVRFFRGYYISRLPDNSMFFLYDKDINLLASDFSQRKLVDLITHIKTYGYCYFTPQYLRTVPHRY